MEGSTCRVIGYYVTEKKNAKMNWAEFGNICRHRGFSLVKINLKENMETQGPFFAIVHKMTEVIVKSSLGDSESTLALENVESYIRSHPEVIVVDPLDGVRSLLDRSRYYRIVQNSDLAQDKVFTPTFVDLTSTDLKENLQRLKDAGVTYPFVCKPSVSHGSDAHQMAVVFNEEGVADCKPPCVAQSFINHNAVLYKIYVVGDSFNMSERPSLKNFSASGQSTIFFSTSDVSKADSTSSLTVLDPEDAALAPPSNPDNHRFQHIVNTLRRELGMILFGVDVVIEHQSGRYGIIDINIFPSYDGFPNFFETLMDIIMNSASSKNCETMRMNRSGSEKTPESSVRQPQLPRCPESNSPISPPFPIGPSFSSERNFGLTTNQEYDQEDSGFDTGDSSDERKKKWHMGRGRGCPTRKLGRGNSSSASVNANDNFIRAGLSGV